MNGDVESAQSPDTQQKEMVKASSELKKLIKIRDGRRKYVDEVMSDLEDVLKTENKFQKQQKKWFSGRNSRVWKNSMENFGSYDRIRGYGH